MKVNVDRVFISYRRQTSKYPALLVYKALSQSGYDVFIDYESIDSGKFAAEILNQIESRSHFVVILSPDCLNRTTNPGDWLRKEIEYAIDLQRNVVPLLFDGFSFEGAKQYLTGKLSVLKEYNGLVVPDGYFDEAMKKLTDRFLKQPVKGVVRPAPHSDDRFVQRALQKADQAAEQETFQDELLKYLVKPPKGKNQASHSEVRASTDVLGFAPMYGEVIQLDEMLGVPLIWKKLDRTQFQHLPARGKRIIITNKRLILKDLENDRQSFQIPRFDLTFAKITYLKMALGLSYQLIIQLWDGKEYSIQIDFDEETLERVKELIPENQPDMKWGKV